MRRAAAWLTLGLVSAGAAPAASGYQTEGRCGDWPRVAVATAPGHCVALVASAAQGLKFPRRLLPVGPDRFWVVDMGSWERRRGRLLELTLTNGVAQVKVLADGLDRPHGLARGPDGLVYVGEAGRIWRTPVADTVQRETVWDGLPDDGAHPLKELVFTPDGRLFVNLGSATDACRDDRQQQPRPCPELAGERPRASVLEAKLDGPGRTVGTVRVAARGLRNSLALAWDPQRQVLWQGENSVDYPEATEPAEELNRIRPDGAADYGWPYCVADRQPARGYTAAPADCRASTAPARLWPAHAAPLALQWVDAKAPSPWAGHLLAAWHGHRAAGRRVVAFKVDGSGVPAAQPTLVFGGTAAAGQPSPAPAGVTLTPDGRLFIVDDRNKAVLMLVQTR